MSFSKSVNKPWMTGCALAMLTQFLNACVLPQSLSSPTPRDSTDTPQIAEKRGLLGLSDRAEPRRSEKGTRDRNETFMNSVNSPALRTRVGVLSQISPNVWRSSAPATRVFAAIARVVSQNYILSRVDRKNMTLQSDWDKFFIDGRLFRNRIHVSVFPVNSKQTELVVRNNLEYFDGDPSSPQSDSLWLPSADITNEVATLVRNTRTLLQNTASNP